MDTYLKVMVTIITVCVVILTLIIIVEMFASLGHHEEYDEGYHEKLDYLIDRIEQLERD
jgi:hypothetical protein|tara:strand:+ start:1420 stop:1596 length:177 start_codon:yes stop_codon:yes gene_type:complete